MKKTIFTLLLLLLCLCMTACGGCGKDNDDENGNSDAAYEAWSTYNTIKVIQQTYKNGSYPKLSAALSVEMMRGEYEGAQLLVTAGKNDTTAELVKGTLRDENGRTIPDGQVAVYLQMYTQIQRNYNGGTAFGAGDRIPDMMLPMEIAKAYGENTVPAGTNRAFTVEICSDGVAPGTYTGTFVLRVGEEEQNIPVSVTVWDITAEGRRSDFKSSFLIYREMLACGEYRSDKEIVDNYIEFLTRYNADAYVVRDIYEEEHFTESLRRFCENTRVTGIVIPVDFQMNYTATPGNSQYDETLRYITELALASTDEYCLAEYAYFYPSTYDEADVVTSRQDKCRDFFSEDGLYFQTLDAAVEALQDNAEYMTKSAALRERIEAAIRNIPAVFTNVHYMAEWVASFTDATFCPYISVYNDYAILQRYQDQANGFVNGNLWAYSCNRTDYPYPTLDIDDVTLGIRVNGWMNRSFGVNGYLYYMVNKYSRMFEEEDPNGYINVYDDPDRGGDSNGDGFLLYPGAYYGSEYPFATLRLAAYRDGIDDYNMLSIYRDKLNALAGKYGITINFDDYVSDLYASLFNGAIAYEDNDARFFEVRRELAARILAVDAADGLLSVCDRDASVLRLYSADSALRVDGQTLSGTAAGTGYVYEFSFGTSAHTYEVVTSSRTVRCAVSAHRLIGAAGAALSEGSRYDAGTGTFTIAAINGTLIDLYTPSMTFSLDGVKGASRLCFTYGNSGTEEFDIRIKLVTAAGEIELSTNYCPAGAERRVEILLSDDIDWSTVTAIRITFDNVVQQGSDFVLAPDRTLTLSDLWLDVE